MFGRWLSNVRNSVSSKWVVPFWSTPPILSSTIQYLPAAPAGRDSLELCAKEPRCQPKPFRPRVSNPGANRIPWWSRPAPTPVRSSRRPCPLSSPRGASPTLAGPPSTAPPFACKRHRDSLDGEIQIYRIWFASRNRVCMSGMRFQTSRPPDGWLFFSNLFHNNINHAQYLKKG